MAHLVGLVRSYFFLVVNLQTTHEQARTASHCLKICVESIDV